MNNSNSNEKAQGRRRFVKKATVGAALVSLPVRSVWANGITNSIVASGHGSDWANGASINLKGPRYWLNNLASEQLTVDFSAIFGGNPVDRNGNVQGASRTFLEILLPLNSLSQQAGIGFGDLSAGQQDALGQKKYNAKLIAMYFNAMFGSDETNIHNIVYPVANGRPFQSSGAFATHLYSITVSDPKSSGEQLGELISKDEMYSLI